MWTKRELIRDAFGELALQGYEFDITAEEEQSALRRLDAMLALWEAKGVRIGYSFPVDPTSSDPDTPSGIPDSAAEPVFLNLAIRIASSYGKTISAATARTAREGYDVLLWAAARPQTQQMPNTMPVGAGNRGYGTGNIGPRFFADPDTSNLQIAEGGGLDILQE